MEEKDNKLAKLFLSTLYLSAFTFGGGYVIVTLMKQKFVNELKWLDNEETLDLVAIAQSAPGPIAVNASILFGYKVYGIKGMLAAITGTIIPPFVIISIVSLFYAVFQENLYIRLMLEGMQAGVGAVIASVVFDMAQPIVKSKRIEPIIIMIVAFILVFIFNVNVIYIVVTCAVWGTLRSIYSIRSKK